MGYIGNEPTTGHFPVDNFTSSGGSTYTLAKAPASAGAIEVSVQGVLQPTTAYTVSGTTLTMAGVTSGVKIFVRHLGETLTLPTIADGVVTEAKLAVNAVTTGKIAAGAVETADIADDAVSLAKMASGTDGNIITYDASGNPAAVATGTAGQILTSAGAGAPPTFADAAAGGGAWTFISSSTASGSSSIDITTGIDSTYDVYMFYAVDLEFSANNSIALRVGAGSFDSGGSDYKWAVDGYHSGGSTNHASSNGGSSIDIGNGAWVRGDTSSSTSIRITLYKPSDTTHKKTIHFELVGQKSSNAEALIGHGCGHRVATSAITRLQLYPHTGNIVSGTIYMYGLSKS